MTQRTNARLAGFMFLLYIATAIMSMVVFEQATRGAEGTAAILASMAQHATDVRWTILLILLTYVIAVVLAVSLYALTRDVDRDLALLALCCRVTEAVFAPVFVVRLVGLLSIATGSPAATPADAAATNALAGLLLRMEGWSTLSSAICFAVGSTLFCTLFLRGRSIPVVLSWLGVCASILLVVVLPAQLAGFVRGAMTGYVWIPMAVFEVALALWLIVKGVAPLRGLSPSMPAAPAHA